MERAQLEIARILGDQGVIARRDHPELRHALDWAMKCAELTTLLPGIYADPGSATLAEVRAAAVRRADPDAVLTGAAAAKFSFWPELPVPVLSAALPRARTNGAGIRFHREVIPEPLICERSGLRLTLPALTVWDLTPELGPQAIDEALRRRAVTLPALRTALEQTSGRRGNVRRKLELIESRDEPWSVAERILHRILRAAGITGWRANYLVRLAGSTYFLDVAFPGHKVVIEVDGRLVHSSREVFETDRRRQNLLVLAGWRVIRLTWAMLDDPTEVIRIVSAALA